MNCLEFRRTLETDPDCRDEAFSRHRLEGPACAAQAARSAKFERDLRAAVRVDVPDQLESRILLRRAFDDRRTHRSRRIRGLAIAATLLVAVSVGVLAWLDGTRTSELEREVVTLIQNAPYALEAEGPVPAGEINTALAPVST